MAGAIRTGVQNPAYSAGWDLAFHHEDSDDIEAAVGGYTDADDEAPDEYREPPAPAIEFDHECERCRKQLKAGSECACSARSNEMYYSCERCGRRLEQQVGGQALCDICVTRPRARR